MRPHRPAIDAMNSESDLQRDVVVANHILERLGLSNAFGHASARLPGTNRFIFPTRRSPGLADERNLLTIDTDGKVLDGEGEPNTEFWIHARLYAARADVCAVVHAHPPSCICLTQIGEPHRVVYNQAVAFIDGVPEYERIGLIRSRELGDALAQCLGNGVAVMMRGHGITTAAADVRTATVAACFLEESAGLQLRMLAAAGGDGARLRTFTGDEAAGGSELGEHIVSRAWEYYAAVAATQPLGSARHG
jgi:L-fuculose-phosphate aldolase